ncbi:leucine-rich repeat extensin-like protein 6 [Impatiens glandulifera]|uniref:leucine-rich repeat extensin-like protein 6 n=1 Tax=Impatiens glandulifera TaxID=253017 RepID=UPI001FB13E09|nr:leucine-rich repeat extensin-like protein 6 [Impatiens glandulifera]
MATTIIKFNPHKTIFTLLIIGILSIPSDCSTIMRNLIDGTSSPDTGDVKCSSCPPCGADNPCYQSPPPPPPPPKKPPSPKKPPPSSSNCPPPPALPSPGYIYVPGPPGNLYPIDAYYNSWAGRNLPTMMGFGLLVVLGFLW